MHHCTFIHRQSESTYTYMLVDNSSYLLVVQQQVICYISYLLNYTLTFSSYSTLIIGPTDLSK